jgi:hypothetical protein
MEVGRSLAGYDQYEFFILTRHYKPCLTENAPSGKVKGRNGEYHEPT